MNIAPGKRLIDYDGDNLEIGDSATARAKLKSILTASADPVFTSITQQTSQDKTVTVTGSAVGDTVVVNPPDGALLDTTTKHAVIGAWVSAANTVKIRVHNLGTVALAPTAGNWRITVFTQA